MAQAQFVNSLACPICLELFETKENFFGHILTGHEFKIDRQNTIRYHLSLDLCHKCMVKNRHMIGKKGSVIIFTLCEECSKVNVNFSK